MIITSRKWSTLKPIFLYFFLSHDLFLPTHRYRGYCCNWSQPMIHIGRAPLGEGSARRRDLYPTTHNSHKKQTSIPPARLEPATPTSEQPQTHGLDRVATGISHWFSRVPIQQFAQQTKWQGLRRHTLHYDSRRPIKVFLWRAWEKQWTFILTYVAVILSELLRNNMDMGWRSD
jgi:hypothetical protein